jgi:putative flippase GtrA
MKFRDKVILNFETIRFIVVGGLNTIVGYGCYLGCLALGINYLISLCSSHVVGVTHSFFWNKYWTFKSKGDTKKELLKFILVYLVTFGLNLGVLFIMVEKIHFDKRIAQIGALIIVTLISFLGHKLWSFKKS